ncbi:MAG: CopG family transcriptional regulator [Coxiella sp. RIFCSPHIGHO2_12_FULL_42_15]|nr:MAG: CopG family transcriptional regulator [Coxiella sp. RIFCSPHIGHO2_12_FULL_42_15]
MKQAKIAISLDQALLDKVDHLVKKQLFKSRSQAVQMALSQSVERIEHKRLAEECKKLDIADEQKMADEDLKGDSQEWPEY